MQNPTSTLPMNTSPILRREDFDYEPDDYASWGYTDYKTYCWLLLRYGVKAKLRTEGGLTAEINAGFHLCLAPDAENPNILVFFAENQNGEPLQPPKWMFEVPGMIPGDGP
jgi:hypothetical protein